MSHLQRCSNIQAATPNLTNAPGVLLQRTCACGQHTAAGGECAECKQKRDSMLQRAMINPSSGYEVPPLVREVLRSPGQSLDAATRSFMEPRFGHDFSRVPMRANGSTPVAAHLTIGAPHDDFEQEAEMMAQQVMSRSAMSINTGYDFSGVRIHTDARAAESAQAVNALAYTVGQDIVFGPGQYKPNTGAGAKLMAHELTHVIQQSGAWGSGTDQRTNERRPIFGRQPTAGAIARQPATPGWSDAPDKSPNRTDTTVDEKGKISPGKVATKGVWRVPVAGLGHGYQGKDKGPAHESPEGRAVALIPNTVKPAAPAKDKSVSVDVLLHFHGYGIGYRQLTPGKEDYPKVLAEGQVRDVELYQMEQQLLSHVAASKQLLIAVLPQGSEKSSFGDIGSNSDAYLKEVFSQLSPTYLPENSIPGRVTVSGHSGGGPPAMAIANQRAKAGKRTDVLLFDAINSSCEKEEKKVDGKTEMDKSGSPVMVCKSPVVCKSYEYNTASQWVTDRINADVQSLKGIPEDQQPAELQTNGTRFRGLTSGSLATTDTCSYSYWYNKLKNHIETTVTKLKVSEAVRDQLRRNYQVREAPGLESFRKSKNTFEPHERMMGQGNLEAALKE